MRMSNDNPYQTPEALNILQPESEEIQLQKIAKGQRMVLYAILLYILLIIGQILLSQILMPILFFVPLVLSLIGVTFLAHALWQSYIISVFYFLVMFVPLLNILLLIFINSKASTRLRAGGYKVGLMGAYQ